ncbi:MAG: FtsX-like permease family protein [Balneola sp.]
MFKNYIKIAIRNLLKNKVYSLINILGLSIGLATSLLIFLYVINEWNYDRFNSKSEQLFRVIQTMESENNVEEEASTPFLLGPVLDAEFPDLIEKSVRFYNLQETSHTFRNKQKGVSFTETNFYFVDSTFFDLFSANLIRGNPSEVLKNPGSLVISEELSEKYFGNEDPIGKTLNYKGVIDLTVTGIMEAWPDQSHMEIDLIASFTSLNEMYSSDQEYDQSWLWNPIWTYILLAEETEPSDLETQFPVIEENYFYAYSGWPAGEKVNLSLQSVTDIHLHSALEQEMEVNSSVLYLYILLVVAGFILIIACINFMNLSTARSLERSREVGMRKVLGGYRKQLFYQFIGESFLICLIAIVIGVILVFVSLPYFSEMVDKELTLNLFSHFATIPTLLLLTVFVGLFAGSYPAVYLSSFEPVQVLKGSVIQGRKSAFFRKMLVTFQFTLSIALIIGTAVIYKQIQFIQEKDLGFDESSVVLLPTKQNLIAWKFETFKDQVLSFSQIESITGLSKVIGSEKQENYHYVPEKFGESNDELNLAFHTTHDLVETFDLELIAGRSFSRDFPTDADQAVLINRKMLEKLELNSPEEALGEVFFFYPKDGGRITKSVIGVLEDFNYASLKKEIEPLSISLVEGTIPFLGFIEYTAVEIAPGNPKDALAHIEKVWKEVNPIDPFEFQFLDDRLAEIYEAEDTMSSLSIAFSILCILIASLGLLGLASYSAQLKEKEIGIRKSLGASVSDIVKLLTKDFLTLIGIANLISWPIIYFIALNWLQNFPYRFDITTTLPFIFIGAGVFIMIISLITISYHALRAALVNPVDSIQNN